MNDVTEGIVLSNMEYREKDALVSVLTKDFGRIAFVAKGVLSIQSKNAPGCTPYTTSEFSFDYKEGKTVFPLKTAKMNNSRRALREDLDLLSFAGLLCELSEKASEQGVKETELYEALDNALNNLKKDRYLSCCLFLAWLQRFVGVEPVVDQCVICGKTTVSSISIKEGGFVCSGCQQHVASKNCTLDDLIHFRVASKAGFEHFDILQKKYVFSFNDVRIMMDFLLHHTGMRLHSWTLIHSLMD